MRYNDDVINAENWNTGLTKTELHLNPDADEIAEQQNKTLPRTIIPAAVNLSAPPDAKEINHRPEAGPQKTGPSSPVSTHASRSRINRRKKSGMILLSGFLFGLVSRGRSDK